MTDGAKALTKRTAVSALVVLLVLMVFRALLLWVLVALVGWWVWKAVSRRTARPQLPRLRSLVHVHPGFDSSLSIRSLLKLPFLY